MSEKLYNALVEELAEIGDEIEKHLEEIKIAKKRKNRITKLIKKMEGEN